MRTLLFIVATLWLAAPALAGPVEVWPSPRAVAPDADGRLRFDLVAVNTGTEVARDVVVSDSLAPGATLVSSEPAAARDGDRLVWSLGDVPPGGTARVRLVVAGGTDGGARLSATVGGTARATGALPVVAQPDPGLADVLRPTLDADAADPEVLAVVAAHDGDPARLRAYVRGLRHEVYRGSLRGARGTIWSGAGNALDRASLLVALLRAAGVPARYARTTLDPAAAADVVRSMFPPATGVTAAGPTVAEIADTLADPAQMVPLFGPDAFAAIQGLGPQALAADMFGDPAADPELLAMAAEHYFVESFAAGAWTPFDPSRDVAPPAPEAVFAEVDAAARHTVTVALTSDTFNPLFGAVSISGDERLRAAVPTVRVVGRPLALRYLVDQKVAGGLVFTVYQTTYRPVLLADGQLLAEGEAFQEVVSNFPGGNQILTGLFVDVTLTSPGAAPVEYRHTIVDRLGHLVRSGGGVAQLPALDGTPALSGAEVTLLHVASSVTPGRVAVAMGPILEAVRAEMAALLPRGQALEAADPATWTAADRTFLQTSREAAFRASHAFAEAIGLQFLDAEDRLSTAVAETLRVVAYTDRPRLVIVDSLFTEHGPAPAIDIAVDRVRALAPADVGKPNAGLFQTARGLMKSSLEGETLALLAGADNVVSMGTVFEAAAAQGIQLRMFDPSNAADLERLGVPADARSRIHAALRAGRHVYAPEAEVQVAGAPRFVWLEMEPDTGFVESVDARGMHPAAVEYAMITSNPPGAPLGIFIGAMNGFASGILAGIGPLINAAMSKSQGATGRSLLGKAGAGAGKAVLGCLALNFGPIGSKVAKGGLALEKGAVPFAAWVAGELIKKAALRNAPGLKNFVTGMSVGMCEGQLLAQAYLMRVYMELVAIDPPLPVGAVGLPGPVRRPPHQDDRDALLAAAPGDAAPPALYAGGHVRAVGALSLAFDGDVVLGAARVAGEGLLLDADGLPVAEGPYDAAIVAGRATGTVTLSGEGAADHYGDRAGATLGAFDGAVTGGQVEFLNEDAEKFTFVGDASLTGAALETPLPARPGIGVDGTLWLGRTAYDGFTGTMTAGDAGFAVDGAAQGRLALLGLPQAIDLSRGEPARLLAGLQSTAGGAHRLFAEGPDGWDVAFDGDALVVRPRPGERAGEHTLHVWVRPEARSDLAAGAVIPVRLADGDPAAEASLTYEPLLTLDQDGVPLPVALRGTVVNRGPETATFALAAEVPAGFTARLAAPSLTLRPGERGTVFLYALPPSAALPAPGTSITVRLRAAAGPVLAEAEASFGFPAVTGAVVTLDPPSARVTPGGEVSATLKIAPVGNAPATFALETLASRHLTLAGVPATLDVTPGADVALPVTLRLSEAALPGLRYAAQVTARLGEVVAGEVNTYLEAIGPEAQAAEGVADAATEAGRADLARSLQAIADQLDQLRLRCDPAARQRLAIALRVVAADLSDPAFADVAERLRQTSFGLEATECAALDLGATVLADLDALEARLRAVAAFDFRLTLDPGLALVRVGEAATFGLKVEPVGAQGGDVRLELLDVPGEVATPVTPPVAGHAVVVRPDGAGRFPFRVRATSVAAPELSRVVGGVVVAEDDWVRVAGVGATPPFALPGARLRPFVRLFNVANVPQDLVVDVELRRPDGSLLYVSPEALPVRVAAIPGVQEFPLGDVVTFGEAPGVYTLHVAVRPGPGEDPIPGGEGLGHVFLGQPLSAEAFADPPILPPGDVDAQVAVRATRRPLPLLPGVGIPNEIELFTSSAEGPVGLAVTPDGTIYASNFGSERQQREGSPGEGNTITRIPPGGQPERFAQVPAAPTDMVIGPDGALYVANASNPERITRVSLPDGAVTTYIDFGTTKPGGRTVNNPLGIVFDAAGNLYVAELYDLTLFTLTFPGTRIYRVFPDADGDGRADGADQLIVSDALKSPTRMTIDPRTQDLIVCDAGNDRVVRINTIGAPQIHELARGFANPNGVALDPSFNLYVLDFERGDVKVWATDVVDGHTVVTGEPLTWLEGLSTALTLVFDPHGDALTTNNDADQIVRVRVGAPAAEPEIGFQVAHRWLDGADPTSGAPDLGAGGPLWGPDAVEWIDTLAPDEREALYAYRHALSGARPGEAPLLTDGAAVTLRIGGGETTVQLPPVGVVVDHLVGLSPDRREIQNDATVTFQVRLQNHRAVADTVALSVDGVPPGVAAQLAGSVNVPAKGTAETTLTFTGGPDLTTAETRFTVQARSAIGGEDRVVGELLVTGDGLEVELDPPTQSITWGESATYTVRVTNRASFQVFVEGTSEGLATVNDDDRGYVAANLTREARMADLLTLNPGQTKTSTITIRPIGPPGHYAFRVKARNFRNNTPPINAYATGALDVVGGRDVSVAMDPAEQRSVRQSPRTFHAILRNEGAVPARYTVTATQPLFVTTQVAPGPYDLAPGQSVRVPVVATPTSSGSRTFEVKVTDADAPEVVRTATARLVTADPGVLLELAPAEATAAGGVASFVLHVKRQGSGRGVYDLAVDGPLAAGATLGSASVNTNAGSDILVPLTIGDLEGLSRGPWPVRVRATLRTDATLWDEVVGAVVVPAGGLEVAFEDGVIAHPRPEPVETAIEVANLDFESARTVALTGASAPAGVTVDFASDTVVLPPGARARLPVTLRPSGPGEFVVRVTATADGVAPASAELPARFEDPAPPDLPPIARAGGPYTVGEGEVLALDAGESVDPEGAPLDFAWDLDGDGEFDDATGPRPEHTFGADGEYEVAVRVTAGALASVATAEVTVEDGVPTAAFDAAPQPQREGAPIRFTDGSTSPADAITAFAWDFAGLGASGEAAPTFTFASQGRYDVTLTVTDADGSTARVTRVVEVLDGAPSAALQGPATLDEGAAGAFDATGSASAPDAIVRYEWDWQFDGTFDASGDEGARVTHAFPGDGAYVAAVRVTDSDGSAAIATLDVTVNDLGPTAAFVAPDVADEGAPVRFADASTSPVDALARRAWDFDGLGASADAAPAFAFPDDRAARVCLTVTDADGSTDTACRVLTVRNVAPGVAAGDDVTVPEGSPFAGEGAFTDPGADTWTATADYGEGPRPLDLTGKSFALSAVFADDGVYPVTVAVADDDGGRGADTLRVTVVNVDPEVEIAPEALIEEGGSLAEPGLVADPGADTWTATVDYGDGTEPEAVAVDAAGAFLLEHAYAASGTFVATVTVTDDDGGVGVSTVEVTVENVAPVVDAGEAVTVDEGAPFAGEGSFTDPGADAWTATVDYGDGAGAQPLALDGKTFALSHTYADDGEYAVTVSVRDEADTGAGERRVTVRNVAPSVAAGPDARVAEGAAFAGAGSFADPGADAWTATVDYGDGSGPRPLALDGRAFALAHTYADDGAYTVTVTVADDDGGVGSDTLTVVVDNVAPSVQAGDDAVADEGAAFAGAGRFADPGADTWTATVDYGDGSGPHPLALDGENFVLSHTYADDGAYVVTVVVTDDDGGVGRDTRAVTVLNVAPTVDAGGDVVGECAEAVALNATFRDPGVVDTHEATVDWGDGTPAEALTAEGGRVAGEHVYPAVGAWPALVNVVDDDGGWGADAVLFRVADTRAPSLTCPADVTLDADARCVAKTALEARAEDACRGDVRRTDDRPAVYPLGRTTVTFTAADAAGNRSVCDTAVEVVDRTAPLADAGPDRAGLEADASCAAAVTLDGRASHDNCGVASYRWTSGGAALAEGPLAAVELTGMGERAVTLTVCDAAGACDADEVVVEIATAALACSHVTRVNAKSTGEHLLLDGVFALNACAAVDLARDGGRVRADGQVYEVPAGGLAPLGKSGRYRYAAPRAGKTDWTLTIDTKKGTWDFDGHHVPTDGLHLADGLDVEIQIGAQVARERVPVARRGQSAEHLYDAPRGAACP